MTTGRLDDSANVGFVRSDDNLVAATECALDHRHIDDVIETRSTHQDSDSTSDGFVHGLDFASDEQPSEACLASAAAPGLSEDRRRHDRDDIESGVAGVKPPHCSVIAFRGDQCACVVSDARQIRSGRSTRTRSLSERLTCLCEPLRELFSRERTVVALPFGDASAPGLKAKTARSRLGDPRAEARSGLGRRLLDRLRDLRRE
jgi:hypothetical protein